MKRPIIFTGALVLVLAGFSDVTLAQSGANCTSGGSHSSFRVLQQEQLQQSAAPARSQFSMDLPDGIEYREIFGRQLMSERELKSYIRKVDRYASKPDKQAEYIARHREKMLSRARKKGIDPADLEPMEAPASP